MVFEFGLKSDKRSISVFRVNVSSLNTVGTLNEGGMMVSQGRYSPVLPDAS